MSGERNLKTLLKSMSPQLLDGEYVFCTFKDAQYGDYSELQPIATVSECEGLTLVVPRAIADERNVIYETAFKGITLKIHSSLNAIGLTAAFSKKLSEHGISANVYAGFFHDHIFVQSIFADQAMAALKEFAV